MDKVQNNGITNIIATTIQRTTDPCYGNGIFT
jgi:hypothetical protein